MVSKAWGVGCVLWLVGISLHFKSGVVMAEGDKKNDKKTGIVMCRGRIHYFYKNSRVCACGKKVKGQ